jgi:hypothetical protein
MRTESPVRLRRLLVTCTLPALVSAATLGSTSALASATGTIRQPPVSAPAAANASQRTTSAGLITGYGWTIVPSPDSSSTQDNVLAGVSCISTTLCWTAGDYRGNAGYDETLIEQWNGTSWNVVASPNATTTGNNDLFAVGCANASFCMAVGGYFDSAGQQQTLAEEWNGTSWTIVSSPNVDAQENGLQAVSCISAVFCVAAGGYADSSGDFYTLIEEWNGASWSVVASPNLSSPDNNFEGVTCVNVGFCVATGAAGNFTNGPIETLIEMWNGTSWGLVSSPNTGEDSVLVGVTCVSVAFCMSSGYYRDDAGTLQTLAEESTGGSWTLQTPPNTGTADNVLYGLSCTSASFCVAAGYYLDGSGNEETLIENWTGSSWSIVSSPDTTSPQDVLAEPSCASSSFCVAVGYNDLRDVGGYQQTLIEEWTPTSVVTGLKAIGPDGKALKCPPSYGTSSCAGGPISGGTRVTITGVNFQPTSTVTFGGTRALSQTFKNSHTIIAYSPPVNFYSLPSDSSFHSAADVYVQVTSGCCGSPSSPGPSSRFTYFVPQIGLLIFNGGTDVCAATVVTSPKHATVNTILTAGHCVANGGSTSGPGSFNSDFEFAPGYYGPISCPGAPSVASPFSLKCGTAPYGIWNHWYRVATDKAWLDSGDHQYDYGFLDMSPQHGVSISSRVGGGLVITFNSGGFLGLNADQPWTLFGDNLGGNVYGTESGTALKQCTGQAVPFPNPPYQGQLYVSTSPCPQLMFQGNSGGPWINPLNGYPEGIGAVNSTAAVTGTYLGDAAQSTFGLM